MAVYVRFLESCFELKADGATVLTDPFLTGNPLAAASADQVEADEHPAHMGTATTSATRNFIEAHRRHGAGDRGARGRDRRRGSGGRRPNLGGTVQFDWGWGQARRRLGTQRCRRAARRIRPRACLIISATG